MIHIEWPWMALCLPLPFFMARAMPPARPAGGALFVPFAENVGAVDMASAPQRSRWRQWLFVLVWLALVAAAVRPQWLGDPQPVATTGRRLLLAVDVSGSMATRDMAGNESRLQVVQQVAGDFVRRRHGDQVGLILFGTRPYLQAPLTADLGTVGQFLREAVVGVAGPQTAIGDAIGLAIKRLKADPSPERRRGDTVLVLLTDGANDAGEMPPLEAAKLAAASGLRIYTIGVGAEPGSGFLGMGGGNDDLDENALQGIAQATGGAYFRASDSESLEQVYAHIDELEPSAGRDQWYRPRDEWFHWPLALALALSLPGVLIRGRAWT